MDRRHFLRTVAATAVSTTAASRVLASSQDLGARPPASTSARVLNPRGRVPVGLIIDDSTCLANLAHFCIPQFAEVFPDRYLQDWRSLPREIPDSFVREFAGWSMEQGVKGKYSIVPYPACVGWVDRDLPGWSRADLERGIDVVRRDVMPNWDIHPEMITHTWVIDTKTGRPLEERSPRTMENWDWSVGKSADELADYLAYALRILKNAGLPCEGVTTPGGFGNRSLEALSQGTFQACRDVFGAEIPHYFRHLFTDGRSVAPRVEYASGLDGDHPECCVSIIGCTGDWFGGWDGLSPGSAELFITADLMRGRMVEVIERGEPAIMVCHWPGIYYNGIRLGFDILKTVVHRLKQRYDHLIWMKNSEVARYWAAKELTAIEDRETGLGFRAPYACPDFTVSRSVAASGPPSLLAEGKASPLREVGRQLDLVSGTWHRSETQVTVCFDLPRGASSLEFGSP